jgi:hypothetical protein
LGFILVLTDVAQNLKKRAGALLAFVKLKITIKHFNEHRTIGPRRSRYSISEIFSFLTTRFHQCH